MKDVLEQIDIGGVALLRAAAKNFPFVAVASRPDQYAALLAALKDGNGTMPEPLSRQLATEVFRLTSRYDQHILAYMASSNGQAEETASSSSSLLAHVSLSAEQHQALRYGENAHQAAAWYVPQGQPGAGLAGLTQVQGKPLSYNNVLDADAAVRCAADFDRPTCVIIKHTSPCGVASAESASDAYRQAVAADAESAFGGIVALNRPLDGATASQMTSLFLEVIIAPEITPEAKERLAAKPNLRVLVLPASQDARAPGTEWRSVLGGWLVQEPDRVVLDPKAMRVVTKRQPSPQELRDMTFAWTVTKHVRSNAIVLAKQEATVGMGQGQPSRVRAVRLALLNAKESARGAVLASDGFFPFPDNVEFASAAGVTAVIQPGGSVKDPEVIAAADQAGLAMVFTGIRHFKH
jgi:phosphoribosylaminoimidazolecarboxamide formyltransferase/IMP cyclohydrolase